MTQNGNFTEGHIAKSHRKDPIIKTMTIVTP